MRKIEGRLLSWRVMLLSIMLLLCFAIRCYADSVTLGWDANTGPDLAGYKLYYKKGPPDPAYDGTEAAEGVSPITIPLANLSDLNNPQITITIPSSSDIWFFVVTAYDRYDLESMHSNQAFLDGDPPTSSVTFPADQSRLNTVFSINGISAPITNCNVNNNEILVTDGSNYLQADNSWTNVQTWIAVIGGTPNTWSHDVGSVNFTPDTSYTVTSRFTDSCGNTVTSGTGIQFTYDKTNPYVLNYPSIDFINNTIDLIFNEGNINYVTVEANYRFSPSLNFATTDGTDDITNPSGSTYRLAMASIPAYTIYTLNISNLTDTAGNLISQTVVKINDNDQDQMADDWEADHGVDDPQADPDGDGFVNFVEYVIGTGPLEDNRTLPDLDADGMPDVWEQANGLDPSKDDAANDLDRDTLSNDQEYLNGTDPWETDTDHDGIGDGTEINSIPATDPLDPASLPSISLSTSRLQVTDVTPVAFSLVWVANKAATCFVNIYADPDGNQLIKGLTIWDESFDHPPAGQNGVLKVSISGLAPDTTYYYRIVTISTEGIRVEPASGLLSSVRTESITTLVNNDTLAHAVLQEDGTTPALGALLIADVQGGNYPITGWVGVGGEDASDALLDLNNVYSAITHSNLELASGEVITLGSIGGSLGFQSLTAQVPVETGGGGFQRILAATPSILDATAPEVQSIMCATNGAYKVGEQIPITIAFSEPVTLVGGSLRVTFDTGRTVDIDYISSNTASTVYVVQTGDTTNDLTVTSLSLLGAATLGDAVGNNADLTLPVGNNLADNNNIIIDTTAPTVTITSPNDGDYLYLAQQLVRWTVDELADIIVRLNGTSKALGVGVTEDTVVLVTGGNTIEVIAIDQAGNDAKDVIQVTLDSDNDGDGVSDYLDPDDDNDLMPDSWESANGLDPFDPFDARLDTDGDGHANLTEYTAGTDPQLQSSYPIVTLGVYHITVTDVTLDGFSVIWQATEPSTCSLEVYDDTGALLTNLTVDSESALHAPAEDNGVMKVGVSGLQADTTYQFQTVTTSKTNGLALFTPSYPQLIQVTTESANATVANDSFQQKIYDVAGNNADGTLLVVSVEGGDYPVSAWVGDAVSSPWAQVDLNLIYSQLNHENLQLLGDEELTLWAFGGLLGNYVNVQKCPSPTGGVQPALPDASHLNTASGYHLDLNIDLNVVGMPVNPKTAFTSYSLLLYLKQQAGGDPTVVQNIKMYNDQTGTWEMASWFLGVPAGVDFPIKASEAYLIYMKQDMNGIWFEGIACGAAVDLSIGLNLLSLPAPKAGFAYTSYQMLQDLGNENQVSSIKRYDSTQGWETTAWFLGSASGALYSTSGDEGYLIYMEQQKLSWRPY